MALIEADDALGVRGLLASGDVDVNLLITWNWTASPLDDPNTDSLLGLAAATGSDAVVRALLEAGADPNQASPASAPPLWLAVLCDELPTARALIEGGADVNGTYDGTPSLHLAAQGWNADMVALLLSSGADIHAVDAHGNSVLHAAGTGACGDLKIHAVAIRTVELLIAGGADRTTRDAAGRLPCQVADWQEVVSVLQPALPDG